MNKGLSPVVAVVLLIAISVISAVGLYYWIGGLTGEQESPDTPGVIIAVCNAPNILVTNSGTLTINGSALEVTNIFGDVTENVTITNNCNGKPVFAVGETCVFSTDAESADKGIIFATKVSQATFNC